jgi:hypothetical protein
MSKTTNKRLTIVDAARLLYRTDEPSDQQIGRIYERMKAGAIRVADTRGEPHDWLTTEQALADYVAAEMVKRQGGNSAAAVKRGPIVVPTTQVTSQSLNRNARTMKDVYHSIWRDAFLAVLLRRRIEHRSANFHRGVLVSQVVLLIALVATVLGVVRIATGATAPERVAIEHWIEENTDTYGITRWHPTRPAPDGSGVLVEVEYRYTKETRRPVNTRRTFRVVGRKVTEESEG